MTFHLLVRLAAIANRDLDDRTLLPGEAAYLLAVVAERDSLRNQRDQAQALLEDMRGRASRRAAWLERAQTAEARVKALEEALPNNLELTVLRNLNDAVDKRSEYWPGCQTLNAYIERVCAALAALDGTAEST